MSHYSEVQVEFRDKAALVAALGRLGFGPDKLEVHQEAKALYGYQGDKREQQGQIIIQVDGSLEPLAYAGEHGRFIAHRRYCGAGLYSSRWSLYHQPTKRQSPKCPRLSL